MSQNKEKDKERKKAKKEERELIGNKSSSNKPLKKKKQMPDKKFWVFMIPVIAIVIITILNGFFIVSLWSPSRNTLQEEKQQTTETAFISTGIEVVAIALAVWAGLNIVNAIERKEFDSFNKNIRELTGKEVSASLYDRDKESFCQELLKTRDDPLTLQLYREFSEDRPTRYPFDVFYQIEQLFSQVYALHKSDRKTDNELNEKADKGIDLIRSVNSKTLEDEKAGIYLEYRLLEFEFYKGYCDKDDLSRYRCFKNAAEGYYTIAPAFKATLPIYDEDRFTTVPRMPHENDIGLTVYMANSIGESCSKIMQLTTQLVKRPSAYFSMEMLQEYGKQALFYLKCAATWCEELMPNDKREVYFRNYAIALENYERYFCRFGTMSSEILAYYKKAFQLILNYGEPNHDRIGYVYRSLMFYTKKYIDHELKIRKELTSVTDFTLYLAELNTVKEDVLEQNRTLYDLSSMASSEIGLNTYVHCMKGFALRNIILLKGSLNPKVKDYFPKSKAFYRREFESVLRFIRYIELDDGFAKNLRYYDEKVFRVFLY